VHCQTQAGGGKAVLVLTLTQSMSSSSHPSSLVLFHHQEDRGLGFDGLQVYSPHLGISGEV
jgi:hypothetical protein